MSKKNINAVPASVPTHTLHVAAPKDGLSITVNTTSGTCLYLDFDPTEADHSRQGTDLVFTFSDGNTVMLTGFFAVGSDPLPVFILPDGTQATAKDLFADIDISTAAGPGLSVAGGVGTFLTANLVYVIISDDALTSISIGGTTYAVAAEGSASGTVSYQISIDADGGCGIVSNVFVMADSTPGTGSLTSECGVDLAFSPIDDYVAVSYNGYRSVMVDGSPVTEKITDAKLVSFDAEGKATVYTGLGVIEFQLLRRVPVHLLRYPR